jgi:hypothetical protein
MEVQITFRGFCEPRPLGNEDKWGGEADWEMAQPLNSLRAVIDPTIPPQYEARKSILHITSGCLVLQLMV